MSGRHSNIVLRREAKSKGLARYFTGKPCVHGHRSERFTLDGHCVACKYARNEIWRQRNGDWATRYPDKRRARDKRRYQENPERVKAKNNAFHRKRPEVRRALNRKRRATKLGAKGRHVYSDVLQLFKKQHGECARCKFKFKDGNYHIDHKTPLSRGGSDYPRNLQLLCKPCNDRKGTMTQKEWFTNWGDQ